ncbi:histone-lysine N-methyltransferase SETDB1-A isoform X2 [Sparus aurata]|nr:histone-lysine N-methyltransferase SETDB1-B-like isoform X2 [Sparus aurata]XP_030267909.1 histone-lysine N-methyltransferase SETDB1-B-like isoform X2 [Sparus aurata]
MEEDELEMTKGELQKWIREQVNKNTLILDMMEKCDLLQSLLERRQKQASQLLKLYGSVAECEEMVKKQYSSLGWEYSNTDFNDVNAEGCGSKPPSSPEFLHTETCVPSRPTTICSSPLLPNPEDSESLLKDNDEKLVSLKRKLVCLKRQPVVLLTRLSPEKLYSFCSPAPQDHSSKDESFNNSGSDPSWEPQGDSFDSEYSISSFNAGSNKRRKIDPEHEAPAKSPARPEASTDTAAKSTEAKSSDARSNLTKHSGTNSDTAENTGATSMAAKSSDAKINTPKSTRPKGFATKSTGARYSAAKSSDARSIARRRSDARGIAAKGSDDKSSTPKGSDTKSNTTRSTRLKGFAAKSTGAKCNTAKSSDAKNMASESSDTKSIAVKSSDVKSDTPKSTDVKSNTPKSTDVKSDTPKSTDVKSHTPKSSDVKSNTPKSTGAKGFAVKSTAAKCNTAKTSTPPASANTNAESNRVKTSTQPAKSNGGSPVGTETKDPSKLPKISVNMNVLARRKCRDWQQGKILDIVTKDNGRLKYKISFEEKERSKSLVSGNHIAFDCMPHGDQLAIGTRVVVKCKAEETRFCPGIVAELPNRKNRMRFLVFMDDQIPVYVGLPCLHLVCRPLADPLDDILDENHRNTVKMYLEAQPYPPVTQYRVGQMINAEFEGFLQKCEVLKVDCSLMQIVFQKDKHKEWIYRGSFRLEHMKKMMPQLESKKAAGQENKASTASVSEKSSR